MGNQHNTVTMRDLLKRAAKEMGPFQPVAYYDERLDLIRVVLRDCSVLETRVSPMFTVLYDNDPQKGQSRCMGFVIKGARHLLDEWGMSGQGAYTVANLLNKVLALLPAEEIVRLTEELANCSMVLRETAMEVDVPQEAAAA